MPLLCPTLAFNFVQSLTKSRGRRAKRQSQTLNSIQENRHLFAWPSYYTRAMRINLGVKAFWGHWTVIINNQLYIENLTWQVESLANWTRIETHAVDLKLQATSKATLQNRLALNMVLLKESGVCGWLNASYPDKTCCVSIPNISTTLHQAIGKMR